MIPNHILLFAVAIPKAVGRSRTDILSFPDCKRVVAVLIPNRIVLINSTIELPRHNNLKDKGIPRFISLISESVHFVDSGLRLAA